ncbi:Wzz/FepE/Etk N-terminal domain-containing protein [Litorilituus lipolyticus]|uniref:Polysaccharide chain length determinant N-terminal domain-containing protein n=1 Tax=Litorilituus lipolyticus TaxID=2491017 RepID=A0A502L1K8_9GAMM|nr:Wzz/FepE/Etk N-terminal domain-containing protein [Litorilituus lipolyticus]TPH17074.1 hypothetical protein EPA86_05165 [Litorilituus lipolyticus]
MLPITTSLVFGWLRKDFWKIVFIAIFFAVISVLYALSLQNLYSSNAKVTSNLSSSKPMSGALANLGGLASLAGVSLGGGSLSPEVLKEVMTSASFLSSFIKEYNIEKEVIAATSYDPNSDAFQYDEKIFDQSNNKWVRKFKFPQTLEPNDKELSDKFKENFNVKYDRKTKLITLTFSSYSPRFSKKVVDDIVIFFNNYMRKKDVKDSMLSLSYLQEQLAKTSYSEVKLALQQIMEEQYKKLALANTREEYALRFIESPLIASKKSAPSRAIICAVITMLGTFLGMVALITLRIFRS